MNSTTRIGADPVDDGAVRNGGEFLVGDRNRSGQPDPRAIFPCEVKIAGGLPDGVGCRLSRLQRIEIENRLEFDEGPPIGVGQRFFADEFAPGECRVAIFQHVLDRLGDLVERPLGAIELDLPALDAGQSGFQRTGQSPQGGIAGHDFDQRRRGFELAGERATSATGRNNSPFFSKNSPEPSGWTDSKCLVSPANFWSSAAARGVRQLRRRPLHHGKNRPVPVESLVELNVALAPIQIWGNQRIDIGVDFELPGSIDARRDRKDECDQNSGGGKPCAGFDNRNNNTCQHIFSF